MERRERKEPGNQTVERLRVWELQELGNLGIS
jgi:hypothetical protein